MKKITCIKFLTAILSLAILNGCSSSDSRTDKRNAKNQANQNFQPQGQGVWMGIDVLQGRNFAELRGRRVGLVTNQSGVNRHGRLTRIILAQAPAVNLVALFSPEHGLDGTAKAAAYIASKRDRATGLPVYSLYGPTRKPNRAMLRGIDTLVFDLQDIGVRSYTYISTMARCMEACGELGIDFVVLDRPNPLGGHRIEGPPLERRWTSFVGQVPTPYIHSLTVGELARMINGERWMSARPRLTVIRMLGWDRNMTWADTGLRWIPTSPNIPHGDSPVYYAVTGILGSLTGVDIGIGTRKPFEAAGGKNIDPNRFTAELNRLNLPGISFSPYRSSRKKGYAGSSLKIDPHTSTNLCALAVDLIQRVSRHSRQNLFANSNTNTLDIFYKVYGSQSIRRDIERGRPAADIAASWNGFINSFRQRRGPYLLY